MKRYVNRFSKNIEKQKKIAKKEKLAKSKIQNISAAGGIQNYEEKINSLNIYK